MSLNVQSKISSGASSDQYMELVLLNLVIPLYFTIILIIETTQKGAPNFVASSTASCWVVLKVVFGVVGFLA